jgi:multicomponent K+:H+ antiporter subunit F
MTMLVLPYVAIAFCVALALNAYRLVRGPALPDRVLAIDTLYVNTIALLVLLGVRYDTQAYFEAALVVALLGFVSTIALAKFLVRGRIFG